MAFATVADITTRLEESTLSATAIATATALCDVATAVICQAAEQADEDWFDDLSDTGQNLVKGFTTELVCRAMASPQGLERAEETLGAFSRSETYRRDPSTALLLTAMERALIRKVALGSPYISPRTPPIADSFFPTQIDEWFVGEPES